MSQPVALITGAAKRLGANTALRLHELGFTVIIHCNQSIEHANALAQRLNDIRDNSALVIQADLSDITKINDISSIYVAAFCQTRCFNKQCIFILSNAINKLNTRAISRSYCHQYDCAIISNQGLHRTYLKPAHGVVINMCDIHATRPLEHHSAYCMAKAGQQMMTYALANELAPEIRVNGVAPGAIEWPNNGIDGEAIEEVLKSIPLQRKGHMNDIAQAIEYLISAPYVTGQILTIDGGRQQVASKGA